MLEQVREIKKKRPWRDPFEFDRKNMTPIYDSWTEADMQPEDADNEAPPKSWTETSEFDKKEEERIVKMYVQSDE